MFRTFILTVGFLGLALPASANPIDDLVEAARAGQSDTVADLIRGAESAQLRRDMMWLLAASHPDLRSFTKTWADAEPDNPAALTARAWSLYREGAVIRGEASVDHTWPASLAAARSMFQQAFALAEKALTLDPAYLPASDAVIILGEVSGKIDRSYAEGLRILALNPNRHSLVIAAGSQRPNWGGSMSTIEELCEENAELVTDAPGYTSEMCLIDVVIKGSIDGEVRDWALSAIGDYVDEPLMEDALFAVAEKHLLAPDVADRLRNRLLDDDRLTVKAALSGRPYIISEPTPSDLPEKTDFAPIAAALTRDLDAAKLAADRDPGNPAAIKDLSYFYSVAAEMRLREIGYYDIPPPEDILEKYNAATDQSNQDQADLKARMLALLKAAPHSPKALSLAGYVIQDHLPDPLDAVRWNHALGTNAMVYSNYRYDIVGEFLARTRHHRLMFQDRIDSGGAPHYSEAELDKVFDCPYIRTLRLFDAACDAADLGYQECYNYVGLSYDEERSSDESVFAKAEARGACEAEREGVLESLRYEVIDLGL